METKEVVGIDISKDSFDVALPISGKEAYEHLKFSNNIAGFKKFLQHLALSCHGVMEASVV